MPEATSVMTTAIHEAGHAMCAIALGTPVSLVTLREVTTLVKRGCPVARYNEAIISLAGAVAETRHCGYSLDQQAELWGSLDAWRIDLDNCLRHLQPTEPITPALDQARQLVESNWDAIERLARALQKRGRVNRRRDRRADRRRNPLTTILASLSALFVVVFTALLVVALVEAFDAGRRQR